MRTTLCGLVVVLAFGCSHARAAPEARAQAEMTPPGAPGEAGGADPAVTDGDKYTVVTQNERTRVLRYHDTPGAKTHAHHHPDSVLYALSVFNRRLTFPDGKTVERAFKPGDVMLLPAQTHTGENIGTTDTEVLLVELK